MGFKKKISKTLSSTKKGSGRNIKFENLGKKTEYWKKNVYVKKDPNILEKRKILMKDPWFFFEREKVEKYEFELQDLIDEIPKQELFPYLFQMEWIVIYDDSETIAGYLIFDDFKDGKEKQYISAVGSKEKFMQKKKELVEKQTIGGHTTVDYEKNWLVLHRIFVRDEYRGSKFGNALLNHFRNITSKRASSVAVLAPTKDFKKFSEKCDFKFSYDWIWLLNDWLEN